MIPVKRIYALSLIWRKTRGCFQIFGFKETTRRILRETSNLVPASKRKFQVSVLTHNLAIGSAPKTREDINILIEQGYTTVVDLRAERKDHDLLIQAHDYLTVHWVPAYDDWRPKSFGYFEELSKTIKRGLSNGTDKLFICCGACEHRAPLGGLVAMVGLGYSIDEAIEHIRKAQPIAEFLPVYVSSFQEFHRKNPK